MFRAQDSVRDQLVAVKMFRLDAPPEQARQIADALDALVSSLPRHNGLLSLVAAGVERDMPYLVMTHSDVQSLDTRLKPGVPLDPEEALGIVRRLAEAIDAAHARGIVHGSLHPRDVFVDEHGDCRVSGFGVGTALVRAGLRAPVRRPYSPPERLTSNAIEAPADRFALGALAFELLSGRRLVGTGRDAAARCTVQTPDVDTEHLRTALAAMLAEDPAHRPASAQAFAQSLAAALFPNGTRRASVSGAGAGAPASGARGGRVKNGEGQQGRSSGIGAGAAAGATAGLGGAPSPDELALFATQGTLWETEKAARQKPDAAAAGASPSTGAGTGTVSDAEDPLALFPASAEVAATHDAPAPAAPPSTAPPEAPDVVPPLVVIPPPVESPLAPIGGVGDFDLDAPRPPLQPMPPSFLRIDQDEVDVEPMPAQNGPKFIDEEHALGESEPLAATKDDVRSTAALEDTHVVVPPSARAEAEAAADVDVDAAADADADAVHEASADVTEDLPPTVALPRSTLGLSSADLVDLPRTPVARADRTEPAARDDHERSIVAPVAGAPGAFDTPVDDHGWVEPPPPPPSFVPPVQESSPSSSVMFRTEPEPADTGNPLRLMVLVLAIGLAIGAAGGYLVGKRGAFSSTYDASSVPEPSPVAGAGGAAARGATPGAVEELTPPEPVTPGASTPRDRATGRSTSSPPSAGRTAAGAGASAPAAAPNASAAGSRATGAAARATGRLFVRSTPSRAEVSIDGTRRGVTPLSLHDLPFGSYVVRVTRSGYAPEAHRVTLHANRPFETVTFDLTRVGAAPAPGAAASPSTASPSSASTPATTAAKGLGELYVLSRPAGARVFVDGRLVGVTPLLLSDVAPGARSVRLELADHRPWTDTVQVTSGQRIRVAASLDQ